MAAPLSFYSLGRRGADSIGNLIPQSLQVINCRYDFTQADVNDESSKTLLIPYRITNSEQDYGIREGEILFVAKGTLSAGQPVVRSCLNGMMVTCATPDKAWLALDDAIVPIGFSTKTCNVNTINIRHTESPIAAVSGHMTVLNSSIYPTHTGDILIWCLPDAGRMGSQCPIDGSSSMSAMRRIVEPVPLRMLMVPFMNGTASRDHGSKLISSKKLAFLGQTEKLRELLTEVVFHVDCALLMHSVPEDDDLQMTRLTRNVWRTYLPQGCDAQRGTQDGARAAYLLLDAEGDRDYSEAELSPDAESELRRAAELKVRLMLRRLVKPLPNDANAAVPTRALERLVRKMVPMAAIVNQMIAARKVARVTRGGAPGKTHDISIDFGANSSAGKFMGGF